MRKVVPFPECFKSSGNSCKDNSDEERAPKPPRFECFSELVVDSTWISLSMHGKAGNLKRGLGRPKEGLIGQVKAVADS